MLHMKGPISTVHRVVQPRAHSDADVLVAPDDFEAVCATLERHGWTAFRDADAPRLLDLHSRAYRRQGWLCSIDVHRFYPGFFADPGVAFEHLWSRRITTVVAPWALTTPTTVDLAAVVAVHAARDVHKVRSRKDLEVVTERFSSGELAVDALLETAHVLRARTTMRPLFERLNITVPDDLTADEVRAWDVLRANDGSTTAIHWYVAWRTSTRRERLTLIRSAMRALMRAASADSDQGLSRWRHVLDKIMDAITEVRRLRRTPAISAQAHPTDSNEET